MTKERNDLKAGIFIAISIVLIVAVIVGIKGVGRILEPSQHAIVMFKIGDDIGGLRAGGDVRVGGYKVGVVRDIEILHRPGEEPRLLVRCSVPARFQIKKDARVRVQDTLTGSSWLNFDHLGSPDAPLLAVNDVLTGRPSAMTTLLASAGDMVPEMKGIVSDVRTVTIPKVNSVIDDVRTVTIPKVNETIDTYRGTGQHATALVKLIRSKIDPVVERFYAIADTAREAAAHLRDVFGESKMDLKTTIANLSAATGTVKDKLPGIMDKVDGVLTQVDVAIQRTNTALEDIKQITGTTKDTAGAARSLLVSNRGKIDNMIASLKTTGDNLKYASAEIRRSPWRLLYKPGPGEVANLNLYDSARQFAEGANNLNDAASALRDSLNDPDVTQDQVRKLVEQLDKSFENFAAIEQELWKQVR